MADAACRHCIWWLTATAAIVTATSAWVHDLAIGGRPVRAGGLAAAAVPAAATIAMVVVVARTVVSDWRRGHHVVARLIV